MNHPPAIPSLKPRFFLYEEYGLFELLAGSHSTRNIKKESIETVRRFDLFCAETGVQQREVRPVEVLLIYRSGNRILSDEESNLRRSKVGSYWCDDAVESNALRIDLRQRTQNIDSGQSITSQILVGGRFPIAGRVS
jgi:hypothetical protein